MASPFQIITDRVALVQSKLGNRTDINTLIEQWIRDAYIELAMSVDFEELLDTCEVPTVQGTDIYAYPVTDIDANTIATRAIRALSLILSSGDTQEILRRDVKRIDAYNTTNQGPPSIYAPWTTQGSSSPANFTRSIVVRPIPDAGPYTLRWRVWIKPPIETILGNTPLRLPDDWLEIIDYSAAMRGYAEYNELDRATGIQQLLFGADDPRTGKRAPGLIEKRLTAMQAEAPAAEYGIRPKIGTYTSQAGG